MLVSCFDLSGLTSRVVAPTVLADDHALVKPPSPGFDEQRAALLDVPEPNKPQRSRRRWRSARRCDGPSIGPL